MFIKLRVKNNNNSAQSKVELANSFATSSNICLNFRDSTYSSYIGYFETINLCPLKHQNQTHWNIDYMDLKKWYFNGGISSVRVIFQGLLILDILAVIYCINSGLFLQNLRELGDSNFSGINPRKSPILGVNVHDNFQVFI